MQHRGDGRPSRREVGTAGPARQHLHGAARGDRGRRAHIGFRVRGRTFAYYLDDHHGDGRLALNCKVPAGDMEPLVELDPDRFFVPAYLGARGWIGIALDGDRVDWDEIARFVRVSYRLVAPKRLAAVVPSPH